VGEAEVGEGLLLPTSLARQFDLLRVVFVLVLNSALQLLRQLSVVSLLQPHPLCDVRLQDSAHAYVRPLHWHVDAYKILHITQAGDQIEDQEFQLLS
jgi:hypothetical protein